MIGSVPSLFADISTSEAGMMFKGQKPRVARPRRQLSPINAAAAGIDIGATFHVVAVGAERCERPVRSFRSFTADLRELANWLTEAGIKTVAMESTGVYFALSNALIGRVEVPPALG